MLLPSITVSRLPPRFDQDRFTMVIEVLEIGSGGDKDGIAVCGGVNRLLDRRLVSRNANDRRHNNVRSRLSKVATTTPRAKASKLPRDGFVELVAWLVCIAIIEEKRLQRRSRRLILFPWLGFAIMAGTFPNANVRRWCPRC